MDFKICVSILSKETWVWEFLAFFVKFYVDLKYQEDKTFDKRIRKMGKF
jgi:hypothetical protein